MQMLPLKVKVRKDNPTLEKPFHQVPFHQMSDYHTTPVNGSLQTYEVLLFYSDVGLHKILNFKDSFMFSAQLGNPLRLNNSFVR